VAAIFGHAEDPRSQEGRSSKQFADCKTISDDQQRLSCFKSLATPSVGSSEAAAPSDQWPLLRNPSPIGGPDAVSILRTADAMRSSPDLAGLMIRCSQNGGLEVLLALIRPFPPRSKKLVVLDAGAVHSSLEGEILAPGSTLLLPATANAYLDGPWQNAEVLGVKINDPEFEIRGYIPLNGLAIALRKLTASCPIR
jgi:hypothetical protein